jgi:hypothetical protein
MHSIPFSNTANLLRQILVIFGRVLGRDAREDFATVLHYAGLKAPTTGISSLAMHRELIETWIQALDKPRTQHESYLFNRVISPWVATLIGAWGTIDLMTSPTEHKLFKPFQWQEITRRAMAAWNSGYVDFGHTECMKMRLISKSVGGQLLFINNRRPAHYEAHGELLGQFFASQGGMSARVDARTWIEETTPEISENPVFAAVDPKAIENKVNIIEIGMFAGYKGVFVRTSSFGHMRVCNPVSYRLWRQEREAKQRLAHIKSRAGELRCAPAMGDDSVKTVIRENAQRAREYVRSDRMVHA